MTNVDDRTGSGPDRGTCLVTGGAGFIGTAISAGLVERFDRVVAIDCLHPQIHPSPERPVDLVGGLSAEVGLRSEQLAESMTQEPLVAVELRVEVQLGSEVQLTVEIEPHVGVRVVLGGVVVSVMFGHGSSVS